MVALSLRAQTTTNPVTYHFTGAPTGICSYGEQALNDTTGDYYQCKVGTGQMPTGQWIASGNVSSLNNIIFVDGVTYPQTGAGIASAVTAACGSGKNGRVFLPNATYTISSPGLNLTNITGCTIEGASAYAYSPGFTVPTGAVLQCNYTAANSVCVDISGSTGLIIKHVVIACGTSAANAPTVCLLHGRTVGSNGINDKLEDSFIAGYSPWIYYNTHGEELSSIDTAFIEYGTSGVPLTLSAANTAGITSPFVTFGGATSQTVDSFTGTKNIVSSQSTTSTAPNNSFIYLDEGSTGVTQSFTYVGYMNETVATNAVLVQDTAGATGVIENATFNLQVDNNSTTNNTLFNIAGTARKWDVRGKFNVAGNTGGPAFNFAGPFIGGRIATLPNITNAFSSSDASGSILDLGQFVAVTAPNAALIIGADASGKSTKFGTSTVAGLPSPTGSNTPGSNFFVTDAAASGLCAGGNSFKANAFSNGLNWVCPQAMVATVVITGTGACATVSNQLGYSVGEVKCTGTTGAATITFTYNVNAANLWHCNGTDKTNWATANLLHETSNTVTTCVLTSASITQNDIIDFAGFPF